VCRGLPLGRRCRCRSFPEAGKDNTHIFEAFFTTKPLGKALDSAFPLSTASFARAAATFRSIPGRVREQPSNSTSPRTPPDFAARPLPPRTKPPPRTTRTVSPSSLPTMSHRYEQPWLSISVLPAMLCSSLTARSPGRRIPPAARVTIYVRLCRRAARSRLSVKRRVAAKTISICFLGGTA